MSFVQLCHLPRLTKPAYHLSKHSTTICGLHAKPCASWATSLCARGLHFLKSHNVSNFSKWDRRLPTFKWTHQPTVRGMARRISSETKTKRTAVIYITAVGVFMVGMTYAGVPLYRMFCQATGLGGQATVGHDTGKVETMKAVKDRTIRIRFNADTHSSMQWNFRPQQAEVKVLPGETALAFYTAMNPTDKPIIGISTYNVLPFEAGQYFNKIQCFCFEEQRLNPHEKVDMPVFFYIDPEFAEDPKLETIDLITLSYTFFEAKEGMELPMPGFMQNYPSHSSQPQ